MPLGGQRSAAPTRGLYAGGGREAEVHDGEGREALLQRFGVCQQPGARPCPPPPPRGAPALPDRRGGGGGGGNGTGPWSGGAAFPFLSGAPHFGDAQLEVQRLVQRMHGAGRGGAAVKACVVVRGGGGRTAVKPPMPPPSSPPPPFPRGWRGLKAAGRWHGAAVPPPPHTTTTTTSAAGKGQCGSCGPPEGGGKDCAMGV